MRANLSTRLRDPSRGVYFVGTTPPRAEVAVNEMQTIADKLLDRLTSIDYDGLVVYDIQDESSRTDVARPFPFKATYDSRVYAQVLSEKSQHPTITYKSVSARSESEFNQWLTQAWTEYGIRNIVLVGSPSSNGVIKLPLKEAYSTLAQHQHNFNLGGVAIAERHHKKGDEHIRMHEKSVQGCNFFITQAVYNADATIDLLQQYSALCKDQKVTPNRVILTFSPCGSEKTLDFMQWLGISTPSAVKTRILSADDSLAESINICEENLQKILTYCLNLDIPLGLNIESLTNRKEEIDAAIKLFKLLKATLDLNLAKKF
ncbi:MAG: 5,10-methylenetetrahydrofolate reductase [Oceanospirillaceae bacterium]|jgi:5,10-methylenetetrahydrofolate reductase